MIGAIIGDIVGSIYEWNNIKTKDFPLFAEDCFFTDDTVMTCAVAEGIMNGGKSDDFIVAMKKFSRLHRYKGYGERFVEWLISEDTKPYGSFGNGSAMRVSSCAWAFSVEEGKSLEEQAIKVRKLARESAQVTHNHPEGIKGAEATADAIFMCRYYNSVNEDINVYKQYIKSHIQNKYGYDLSKTLDDIRPDYCFNETCQNTVPQAITAFLESTDFEDAVRNAISLGGDSDTLAAITGSIAEAAYGIPEEIRKKALSYLDEHLMGILREWEEYINKN